MKLLLCRSCTDVVRAEVVDWRSCRCGLSSIRYLEDGHHAEVKGVHAEVIGILNGSLVQALRSDLDAPTGPEIAAFVFSHRYERITRRT